MELVILRGALPSQTESCRLLTVTLSCESLSAQPIDGYDLGANLIDRSDVPESRIQA